LAIRINLFLLNKIDKLYRKGALMQNHKKYGSIIFPLLLLLFFLLSCAPKSGDMLKDMVKFDQVYIPPLAFTSQQKAAPSKMSMKRLNKVWRAFYQAYYNSSKDDVQWKADFDKVKKMISRADSIVNSGENLLEAHEALEGVRITFMNLRQRNGIEYFIDYLTAFHEPMEAIALTAKGKTLETLSEEDISKMKENLPEASSLWGKVESFPFNAGVFGFSLEKERQRKSLVKAERQALNGLSVALESGDKARIIKAGVGVKPNFAKLFMMFGDFGKMKK